MDISISQLASQLNDIVGSGTAVAPRAAAEQPVRPDFAGQTASSIDTGNVISQALSAAGVPESSPDMQLFLAARKDGKEGDYLKQVAGPMNSMFKDMGIDVNFKIERSDVGYIVKLVDRYGNVVKSFPPEEVVAARERIREELKGLLEDKKR